MSTQQCEKGHGWLNLDGTCAACKRAPIHPKIGFVFNKGGREKCTVIGVWESRFGDWKVSYADSYGGGGIMNLEYFTERFAPSESHCADAGTAEEKSDGQAENASVMARPDGGPNT